jgi:hypothetical protein
MTAPAGYYDFVVDDPVPVELVSFNAAVTGHTITLSWITSSETNNKGFSIERKSDYGSWINVGYIEGNGTSSEMNYYSFSETVQDGGRYIYRLKQNDFNGEYSYSQETEVTIELPEVFSVSQNYPNPFNPVTVIRYQVPENVRVSIKVYDVLGNETAVLTDDIKPAGSYQVNFNGEALAAGVYYYTIKAGSFSQTKKMILLK